MKKVWIILIVAVLAIVLAAALLVSPLAKRYIENNGEQLIGRQIVLDKLSVNIFTGGLKLEGFAVKEKSDSNYADFVEIGSLATRVRILPLLSNKLVVKKFHIDNLNINLWQRDTTFNFSDIIAHFADDKSSNTPEETQPSKPWIIDIRDIELRNGGVEYRDLAVGSDFKLEKISVDIPAIYFSDKSTNLGLDLEFADGGALNAKMGYNINSSQYDMQLNFKSLQIDGILPYVQQSLKIGKLSGLLSGEFNVVGDTQHIMDFTIKGAGSVDKLEVANSQGVKIVDTEQIYASIKSVDLIGGGHYMLDSLVVKGASALFEMYAGDRNNITDIFIASASETADSTSAQPSAEPTFEIGVLELVDCDARIVDNTLKRKFDYNISQINMRTNDFNLSKFNNLKISALMNGTGRAEFKWAGSLSDKNNQNISVNLNNVNLADMTPYMLEYTAYPIVTGHMSLLSQNVIRNGNINGVNRLEAYKITTSKRDKDYNPEYKIPLRTVLYVLSDKNDKIEIVLPVSGNINSPKFSYRKVIINTLLNLMVKVAVSPFNAVSGVFSGSGGSNISNIEYTPAMRDFSLTQHDRIGELAKQLSEKPELNVKFVSNVNTNKEIKTLALYILKRNFYLHNNPAKVGVPLEILDYNAISAIDLKNGQLIAFADSLSATKNTPATIENAAYKIYENEAKTLLTTLTQQFDAKLAEAMKSRGIDSKRISIARNESDSIYKGKTLYQVNAFLSGDEETVEELEQTEENVVSDSAN